MCVCVCVLCVCVCLCVCVHTLPLPMHAVDPLETRHPFVCYSPLSTQPLSGLYSSLFLFLSLSLSLSLSLPPSLSLSCECVFLRTHSLSPLRNLWADAQRQDNMGMLILSPTPSHHCPAPALLCYRTGWRRPQHKTLDKNVINVPSPVQGLGFKI